MPTLINLESPPNVQGTNVASNNIKRKIAFYQNEERKRQRTVLVGETVPTIICFERSVASTSQSCVFISSGNDKVSGDPKVSEEISKKKGPGRMCPTPGCRKTVQNRGHCREHDPQDKCRCNHTGCKNYMAFGKYCRRHTNALDKQCKEKDCKNQVQARGFCRMHDPCRKRECKEANCVYLVRARGRCNKHDEMHGKRKR